MALENGQEVTQPIEDALKRCPGSDSQDDDPGASIWGKPQHMAEIVIEGDQDSTFGRAYIEQFLVGDPLEVLIPHGHRVVSARLEKLQASRSDILVEPEFHAARSVGTGTIRSRAASAP